MSETKTAKLLETLDKTKGMLKNYPEEVRKEFHDIADRVGEEDRPNTQLTG
jgi:hypothetical protein